MALWNELFSNVYQDAIDRKTKELYPIEPPDNTINNPDVDNSTNQVSRNAFNAFNPIPNKQAYSVIASLNPTNNDAYKGIVSDNNTFSNNLYNSKQQNNNNKTLGFQAGLYGINEIANQIGNSQRRSITNKMANYSDANNYVQAPPIGIYNSGLNDMRAGTFAMGGRAEHFYLNDINDKLKGYYDKGGANEQEFDDLDENNFDPNDEDNIRSLFSSLRDTREQLNTLQSKNEETKAPQTGTEYINANPDNYDALSAYTEHTYNETGNSTDLEESPFLLTPNHKGIEADDMHNYFFGNDEITNENENAAEGNSDETGEEQSGGLPIQPVVNDLASIGLKPSSVNIGKHNEGSKHYLGQAVDLGLNTTFGGDPQKMEAFIQTVLPQLKEKYPDLKFNDERTRPEGQKEWSGSHFHIEHK